MDYGAIVKALRAQAEAIDRAIAHLEALNSLDGSAEGVLIKKRRGRKSMGPEERKEVSARMTRYWAAQRKPSPSSHP